jgi:PPM family protein phosphatase
MIEANRRSSRELLEVCLEIVARTDTGLVRDQNQDRYLFWRIGVEGAGRAGEYTFLAVADGMGGSAAGDRASALALGVLSDRLLSLLTSRSGEETAAACDIPRVLEDGIRCANAEVERAARSDPSLNGMGTTLTVGLSSRGVLYLAQVGDSRCYRLRDGALQQQTTDQSLVSELVRLGKLTPDAARKHPRRNVITQAIGVQEEVRAEITCQVMEPGDLYLFCSDGLWEMVPDSDIEHILLKSIAPERKASEPNASEAGASEPGVSEGDTPVGRISREKLKAACTELVRRALAGGGSDNVTAVLSAVESKDAHPEAIRDAQGFARTRVETGSIQAADLKKTLRFRLQEWQQD